MSQFKNIGKIGVGIVAFEGCEHLYNIISELRKPTNIEDTDNYNLVDTVVICLQKVGYEDNRKLSNIDLNECIRLRDEDHLVDEILFVDLDTTKEARVQETDKRNLIIDTLKEKYGCDYALIMDSDEYYTHKSFKRACEVIDENKYPITYCEYCNYFGTNNPEQLEYSYRLLLKYPFSQGMFVPFLIKTEYKFKFNSTDFNKPSDPTRRVSIPVVGYNTQKDKKGKEVKIPIYSVNYTILPWDVCKMHHLSWMRDDIRKKLEAWSSKKLFKGYNDLIDIAVRHYNTFDVNDPNPQAVMLFNTPGNKVDIQVLDKQYIKPAVDYRTRLRPAKDYKKLLVLTISADTDLFNKLEEVSNETWRHIDYNKYPNIEVEFWTYTDAPDGKKTFVDKEKHIIYIEKDTYFNNKLLATFSKTIEALTIIRDELHLDYEYLIRCNNSTWLNIPLINEILAYEHNDSKIYGGTVYSAFWSAFNIYIGGNLFILSKRDVDILMGSVKNVESAKKLERKLEGYDDCLLFAVLNNRLINLKVPYNTVYHSIGCEYLTDKTIDDNIDFGCPSYQIKTYENDKTSDDRITFDVSKMKELDSRWNNYNNSLDDLYKLWESKKYDDEIWVIKELKSEYTPSDTVKMRPENRMDREYALREYLPNRQKEGKYVSGIFI